MKIAQIWSFIAGDSKRAPLAVAAAVALVLVLERFFPAAGAWAGPAFVAIIATGLVAGVYERTGSS
jgi:hypothetical protein